MPDKKLEIKSKKVKVEKKPAAKAVAKPISVPKTGGLSAPIYSLLGRSTGVFTLPKDIFGAKINEKLISQALRIYLNNKKGHFSNTKTRGEVEGSTRKIFKQKGTGRARHGAIRAPIFVGGGIALGPKFRITHLELPKKMKKAALISSLSQKAKDGEVKVIAGLEKASGKTKEIAKFVKAIEGKSVLFVGDSKSEGASRAARNIKGVTFLNTGELNVLEVVKHQNLIFTKESLESLALRFKGGEAK